jgi:hypothetical protein
MQYAVIWLVDTHLVLPLFIPIQLQLLSGIREIFLRQHNIIITQIRPYKKWPFTVL